MIHLHPFGPLGAAGLAGRAGFSLEHLSVLNLKSILIETISRRHDFALWELDAIYGTFVFLLQLLRLVYELK